MQLLAAKPNDELARGARENLALIAEDNGDLDGALEQYIGLKYTLNIAYFVDVVMTPEQLAGFTERHPETSANDLLFYSLGVRYLRVSRWDDARKAFSKVHTINWFADERYSMGGRRLHPQNERKNPDPKEPYLVDWKIEVYDEIGFSAICNRLMTWISGTSCLNGSR